MNRTTQTFYQSSFVDKWRHYRILTQIWKLETIQIKPLQQNFDKMLFNYKDFTKMKFRIFVSFFISVCHQ